MRRILTLCFLLTLSCFACGQGVKNVNGQLYCYATNLHSPGVKKTFPSLDAGVEYTVSVEIWDSIGTNMYTLTVMNEAETAALGSVTSKRGTPTLTFKMPAGTKDVHFYINSSNSTTGSLPAHNFYIDNIQVTYTGLVTVQEPVDNYRFGFNDKEKDNEIKGTGNSIDFGARVYDSRLGRWMSVDQMTSHAPGWTPYRAFFNNPNYWIDLDGHIEWPLEGTSAKNKRDLKIRGNTFNTIIRTSTYLETRKVGTSPHIGIDYRASIGTAFFSLGDGTVVDIGETKSGIKYITVEYKGGDRVRFLHLTKVADGLKVGSQVLEGQPLGETGNTGKYKNKEGKMINYPPHLHIDAVDKDGNKVDPEAKNYGDHTNVELFTTYGGDYTKLPGNKDMNEDPPDTNIAPPDATRVVRPIPLPIVLKKVK